MITKLTLENFKGFKHLEVPETSTITLIGGQNNIGKTSLLEGIFLFYDTGDPGMFMRHLAWRGINVISFIDPDIVVAPIFYNFDFHHPLEIAVSDAIYHAVMKVALNVDAAEQSITIDLADRSGALPQIKSDLTSPSSYDFKIGYTIDGQDIQSTHLLVNKSLSNLNVHFSPGTMKGFPAQMRNGAMYLGLPVNIGADDAVRFAQLDIENRIPRVIDFLQVLEPNLTGLASVTGPQQISVMYANVGMDRKIPMALLGGGMNRLLSIILAIATAKKGIVLIDEVDAGIHYSHLAQVWEGMSRAAREFNCQIFATTHSYECLQAAYHGIAQADRIQDFRYVRLERHEQEIVAQTYTHDLLGAALRLGWEVR
jgi:hypothetical protein